MNTSSAAEKRVAPRVVVKLPVTLRVTRPPENEIRQASTLNISELGIALSTQFYLQEGSAVEVTITYPEGPMSGAGRVMWSTKLNQFSVLPNFAIGISFEQIAPEHKDLIKQMVKADRKKPRK